MFSQSIKISSLLFFLIFIGCSSASRLSTNQDFEPVAKSSYDSIMTQIPNYTESLMSVKGKGRAIVSEPGNNDRITVDFNANRELSLLDIKNRIGIEGGSMLVDSDSLLLYNKVDKYAQKVSITDRRATSLNELASLNFIYLMNFTVQPIEMSSIYQTDDSYIIALTNGGRVYSSKKDGTIQRVEQSPISGLPYSTLIYDSYGEIDGFKLPRKITILSADKSSQVVFQIRSLEINPSNLNLTLDIPSDIKIQRR